MRPGQRSARLTESVCWRLRSSLMRRCSIAIRPAATLRLRSRITATVTTFHLSQRRLRRMLLRHPHHRKLFTYFLREMSEVIARKTRILWISRTAPMRSRLLLWGKTASSPHTAALAPTSSFALHRIRLGCHRLRRRTWLGAMDTTRRLTRFPIRTTQQNLAARLRQLRW